jgi:hypothetical protein
MARGMRHGARWGDWHLDADTLALVLDSGRHHYEIPLAKITDSAHMLDWIFQVRKKAWATNKIMGDLLTAFKDIFRPQALLCSGGRDKKLRCQGVSHKIAI